MICHISVMSTVTRIERPGKRERTRRQLVEAAVRVFAERGPGAGPIHEIAAEAGVATGTFYNHFRSREEVLDAVAAHLADSLSDAVVASFEGRDDPAEFVAIGIRTFVDHARVDPSWARALLRLIGSSEGVGPRLRENVTADLQAGIDAGRFRIESLTVAQTVVLGLGALGIQAVLDGSAEPDHAQHVAAAALRALGVPRREAERIASRPLPQPPAD
jgi:AcrR family transcriptional regulator